MPMCSLSCEMKYGRSLVRCALDVMDKARSCRAAAAAQSCAASVRHGEELAKLRADFESGTIGQGLCNLDQIGPRGTARSSNQAR